MSAEVANERQQSPPARTRPVGRLLRLGAGLGVLAFFAPFLLRIPVWRLGGVAGVVVGLTVVYLGLQLLIVRYRPTLNPWLGAAVANLPIPVLIISGEPVVQLGAGLYLGLALTLAGVRADAGCEVMSVPGLLLGRRTHLACIAFSPVDWVESRLARRRP